MKPTKKNERGAGQTWLAVETSTAVGSVAVWRNGLRAEVTLRIRGTHSQVLLPAVDFALRSAGVEPEEVTAFVVGSGPGSFTGVRIAASVAKGWVMARKTQFYAYSSLLAVAAGSGVSGPICALFDARRGEVYGACYRIAEDSVTELLPPSVGPLEDVLSQLKIDGSDPAFAGGGAVLHRDAIMRRFPTGRVLPDHLGLPRAGSLLWLLEVAPAAGAVEDPSSWEPRYVRDWRVPEDRTEK